MPVRELEVGRLIVLHGRQMRMLCEVVARSNIGSSEIACLPDNPLTQLLTLCYSFIRPRQLKLARFEGNLWRVVPGELFPPYTISYWLFSALRFASDHGIRVGGFYFE